MSEQFKIETTNFACAYRVFGRCKNSNNKSIGEKIVFETQTNTGICSKEYCSIKIE